MIKVSVNDIIDIFHGYEATGEKGFKHFAVLLPIIGDDPEVLYEVRASKLDRQPGEICFPGGLIEPGESPEQCAVRETCEEVGLEPEDIRIIARLDSVFSTAGSQIHCFLGQISTEALDRAEPSEAEVAELFTVPVNELLEMEPELYTNKLVQDPDPDFPYEKVTGSDSYPWRSGKSPVPVYYAGDRIIWGLTARMTRQFLEIIRER